MGHSSAFHTTVVVISGVLCGPSWAAPPGVVIDHSPAKSQVYIGSPSLAVLPSGEYVASHDFFGPKSTKDTTVVFASADKGKTWAKRATITGQWWSTLFVHAGALYLMGTSKEYGDCVIRKSGDGGETWTEPKDKDSGLLIAGKYHCAPVPVLVHGGRLWRGMEEYRGPTWGTFSAFVMSAPTDADLLKASSWTSSNRLEAAGTWMDEKVSSVLEGNAVLTPKGEVVDVLRVHQPKYVETAAVMRVSKDGTKLEFDPKTDLVYLPGGSKKFTIRYDDKTKRYWALANHVPKEYRLSERRPDQTRNTLALISSADLKAWEVKKDLLKDLDPATVGFQYADWLFDGDDIIAAVRTAFPEADDTKAHTAHDANWLTFHRFEGFRK